jgi:hypothetical protein
MVVVIWYRTILDILLSTAPYQTKTRQSMLTLAEELYLIALDDEKGRVPANLTGSIRFGLAGAFLAELMLTGKITINDKQRVVVNDWSPVNDELLDETISIMGSSLHPRKLEHWINLISSQINKPEKRLALSLVEHGILRKEEKTFLWVIPYEAYPEKDASAKYWRKQSLREVVLAGGKPDDQTLVLLSLVRSLRMLNLVFTHDELKAARQKIDQMTEDEEIGKAVRYAIETVETAAAVAAMAASG